MSQEIIEGIREIEREKGIEGGTLVNALEDALLAAYKKMPESSLVTISSASRHKPRSASRNGTVSSSPPSAANWR